MIERRACESARLLLDGKGSYLDEIVKLSRVGEAIYGQCWDTEFHVFALIASDTDHLPLQHVRPCCSEEFLARADLEVEEVRLFYAEKVREACKAVLSKYRSV